MNSFVLYFRRCRQSVFALIAVALCMLLAGYLWSTWYMRVPMLWTEGCVEVVTDGIGTTRELAENDAKRKAIEEAKGAFIKGNIGMSGENTTTVTSEDTNFIDTQKTAQNVQSSIEADCRSVKYLKHWKDKDNEYHVKIKAIVKKQNEQ